MTVRRLLLAIAMLTVLLPAPAGAAPVWEPLPPHPGFSVQPPPHLTAAAWILYDATGDWVIASHNADVPLPPASTTKMMTALVAVDHASLTDLVPVSQRAADVGEAEIGLVPGEQIPLGDLLRAMVVRSANDAAMAVAEHVGGSVAGFADLMNAKAEELGLTHSHFVNPHGLDVPDHYTSAEDLMKIERAFLENPQLAALARATEFQISPAPDGTVRGGTTTNHLLLNYPGAIGVKTGFTFKARLVLAAAAERHERRLLAVVMGSTGVGGHFTDAAALLDYGFNTVEIVPLLAANGFRIPSQQEDPLVVAARVEAMAWLAAAGLLVPTEAPAPEPVTVVRQPAVVPDWSDALRWTDRYWAWLVGGR
jgi:D-alanyl-D-alanine carboxypeptidase (penicillin-binding protein 5/6)